MSKWYGYCRVSTDKQDEERQVRELHNYAESRGQGIVIVRERASGAKDRPELYGLLDRLESGDTLAVTEFSRLTRRGVPELLEISRAVRERGAALLELTSGMQYDNTAIGELLLSFTATVDRMERERIGERTRSALAARRAQGVILGRPKGTSRLRAHEDEIARYLTLGINKTAMAKLIGCSRGALLHYLEQRKKGPAKPATNKGGSKAYPGAVS